MTETKYGALDVQTPRIRHVRSGDGVTLALTITGRGHALVFVPWVPFSNIEMGWSNPLLNAAYSALGRRLTLIHYDGRGTGNSQRDVADLTPEAMISDLEAIVDESGFDRVSLIGQYSSIPHALAYAARHPDRVERIALFGGGARAWNAMSAQETVALLSLIEQDWNLFAESAAHRWMGWGAGEAGQAVADTIRNAVSPQVARATLQAASATDVTDQLPLVSAPTIVIHRRGVTQIALEVSRDLASRLPNGRLVMVEGSQPALFVEDTEAIVRLLVDFFSDGTAPTGDQLGAAAELPDGRGLSPREREVLRLVAAGESNAEIARRLGISAHTVERHVANIYRKIDARGRADATAFALRKGLA
jgi:DNA-binding CsgD family transcriptional regulator/pimeloyl-ACP methyl ester carboxylesterase